MRDLGPSAGPEPCHCLFQKNPIISNGHVGLLLFSVFNLQHTIFPNWPLFSSAITANGHRTPCQFPQFFRIQDSLPLCERDIYLLNYLKGVGALSQCAGSVLIWGLFPSSPVIQVQVRGVDVWFIGGFLD